MATRGLDRLFYSVGDLDAALTFYCDTIGMKVVDEMYLEPVEILEFHKLTPNTTARAAFLKSDDQDSILELIEFSPNSNRTIRKNRLDWEYGIYDQAWFVKDMSQACSELEHKGYGFITNPARYQPNWVPWEVEEVVAIGPDQTRFVMFTRLTEESKSYSRTFIRWNHVAHLVQRMTDVKQFYGDILGLDLNGDMLLPPGIIEAVLDAPQGTRTRASFYLRKGANRCSLEFLEMNVPVKMLAAKPGPLDLGIFMESFEVDDLTETLNAIKSSQFTIEAGPKKLFTPLHGTTLSVMISGPSGIRIELFQS